MAHFDIVTVCTMNICRSPAMQESLKAEAAKWLLGDDNLTVESAGTFADEGAPACSLTLGALDHTNDGHQSRRLTADIVQQADLILTASDNHVSEAIALYPPARTKIFTIRQSARYADWVSNGPVLRVALAKAKGEQIRPDFEHPETLAEPLPDQPVARLHWLVNELNAARGVAPKSDVSDNLTDPRWGYSDIPDPHVLGSELHEVAASYIAESVTTLSESTRRVLESHL